MGKICYNHTDCISLRRVQRYDAKLAIFGEARNNKKHLNRRQND